MAFISIKNRWKSYIETKTGQQSWYKNWEIYPILLLATFLRFYRVDTSEFDFDQGLMYRLAYDAVHQGLWPVTNSTASLGFANAPGELYLLMIPAAFRADPIYGVYTVSLLASLSVLVTYIFTTRYYGRLPGAIATLLYATAAIPLYYSRQLWQPNMMFLFVILFLFLLFRGVVERRQGWFGPALILLGILYQTHGATLTLIAPFLLALCMAYKTVRWRDVFYGIVGLLVIFFPFLLWQITTHFSDLQIIFSQSARHAVISNDSWRLYRLMVSPYDVLNPPSNPHSFTYALLPFTSWLSKGLYFLVIVGAILALGTAIVQWKQQHRFRKAIYNDLTNKRYHHHWWKSLPILPPEAAGLLLLCTWQIAPIIALISHSAILFPQYMLVVVPGPFILMSYILVALSKRIQLTQARSWTWLSATMHLVLASVILLQLVNNIATLDDRTNGQLATVDGRQYYNDLSSLQKVLANAQDQAQQLHLKRIFIGADLTTQEMMFYFSEHMQYPTSVFFIKQCLLLPSAADKAAILIIPPYASSANRMAEAHGARLLEQIPHLGGEPFSIYELPSAQQSVTPVLPQNTFMPDLQALGAGYQKQTTTRLFTRWSLLHSYPLSPNTTYTYRFGTPLPGSQKSFMKSTCTWNMAHSGDQLLPTFTVADQQPLMTNLSIGVQSFVTSPDKPQLGPFHLETHRLFSSQAQSLHTSLKNTSITIPITKE